ncbi:DUF1616 domain-containing protein [Methanolobus sp. WCC4]|uniref:DUF1616 domain-containing protein n=1 Tax=Methanolobus sp. WCC4 TaxID=3125784 RepID=UPI0030FB55ED
MLNPKNNHYTLDLKIILILAFLSVIFTVIPHLNETVLRIIYASLLIFFIPGYALIAAFFPRKNEINWVQRFTLSVAFSITIVIIDGLLISQTGWLFKPSSITISLFFITCILGLFAYINRSRINENERFTVPLYLKFHTDENEENSGIKEDSDDIKKFIVKNKIKVKPINGAKLNEIIDEGVEPKIRKALLIALLCSLIIVSGTFVHKTFTKEKETFTSLYILGPEGKAENYPSTLSMIQPTSLIVGIENYESASANYTLQVKLDNDIVAQSDVFLEKNEKWEEEVSILPTKYKKGIQKLEFALYKNGYNHRSVYLWVTQELTTFSSTNSKLIDFINLDNPSMESNESWQFTSTNDTYAKGYYRNLGIYSTGGYVIQSTYEGIIENYRENRHSVQQEVQSSRKENVLLSVYLKDTYTNNEEEDTQFKQVILNGDIVWSDGINGDEGWQHIQIPVTIQNGTNILGFTLKQERNKVIHPVSMIIDEISFLPLSEASPYIQNDNTIEFVPPTSKVLPLQSNINTENFTVKWEGTDEDTGILYFDIDYSTDGKKWKRWLSQTKETSATFEGKEGYTYYFRSKAVDYVFTEEQEHSVADAYTFVDNFAPIISLDITPNPTNDFTYITVESSEPLRKLTCTATERNFDESESITLTSSNNIVWSTKYYVEKDIDELDLEIAGEDFAGNTGYTLGTILISELLEELDITIDPGKVTGDETTIYIIPSSTLQNNPTVTVRDSKGRNLEVVFKGYSDSTYSYIVTMDDYTSDGYASVIASATTINSQNLYDHEAFKIARHEE